MKIAEIKVDLIDVMGSDLKTVNSARVSFSKESQLEAHEFETEEEAEAFIAEKGGVIDWSWVTSDRWQGGYPVERLSDADAKLIRYLARHGHWTPFAHCQATLRIKAPIYVARQLVKHQIGLVWNEVSRRYVDDEPEFYFPGELHERPAKGIKQGSGETHIKSGAWLALAKMQTRESLNFYLDAIADGIAPEEAREWLPLNTMTEWYWTGSLMAFARVCKQRLDPHAQRDTRKVAEQIAELLAPRFPVSWDALIGSSKLKSDAGKSEPGVSLQG